MNSLEAWEAPALLCGRLRASLVTLWLSAQNRAVPKNTHAAFLPLHFSLFHLLQATSVISAFTDLRLHLSISRYLFPLFWYFSPATSALSCWVTVSLRAPFLVTHPFTLLLTVITHSFAALRLSSKISSLQTNLFRRFKDWLGGQTNTQKRGKRGDITSFRGIWIIALYYNNRFIWFVGCQVQP